MSDIESKIINLYLKKNFQLNLGSFYIFLNQKSKFNSFEFELFKQKVSEFQIDHCFDQDTLRFLIKIMTAVQRFGQTVRSMGQKKINQIKGDFDFKGVKKKSQNNSSQPKIQVQKTILLQQKKPISQSKISTNFQQSKPVKQKNSKKETIQENIQQKCKKKAHKVLEPLMTISQVQNSSQINLTPTNYMNGPRFQDLSQSKDLSKTVKILNYEKFSADYVNPIIKYRIEYKNKKVLRRFSDFQKLLNILREEYEGFILPKLPPKQGIKAGITYFKGIDQAFLQERRTKLEDMLNRLLENQFVSKDKLLHRFLTEPTYEIECVKEGYGSYIKSITDILFNAKELKDYGVAYCNYLREKGTEKLNPEIQQKYARIMEIIEVFNALNSYRKKTNTNFDKRRQIMHEVCIQSRKPPKQQFDRMMNWIEEEIEDLNYEIENYKELKSQESWIYQLIRQKQSDGPKTIYDLNTEKQQVEKRLDKIQSNLSKALDQFYQKKIHQLQRISQTILEWRSNVHP